MKSHRCGLPAESGSCRAARASSQYRWTNAFNRRRSERQWFGNAEWGASQAEPADARQTVHILEAIYAVKCGVGPAPSVLV